MFLQSSSIRFTHLCGVWLSQPGHSEFSDGFFFNFSHSAPSYHYIHHPAILFLVFLSVGFTMVSILTHVSILVHVIIVQLLYDTL
jgi:hypothetical protein